MRRNYDYSTARHRSADGSAHTSNNTKQQNTQLMLKPWQKATFKFATFQSPPRLPVAACVKLPSAACEGHGRRAHVSGHGPQRAARAERDYRGGEGGERGGRRGNGAHLAALDEENEEVVVAAASTSRFACFTTVRAANPETPAKGHSRFCDFSVATPASDK